MIVYDEPTYGFVVVDGNSALFAKVQGNNKEVIKEIEAHLPNKHNKGGQSSVRFGRLHQQARDDWVKKVAHKCNDYYLAENKVNVFGLVLAGSAEFKHELKDNLNLDKRIQKAVCAIVDVSYGSESGLNEALQRCSDSLKDIQLNKEREVISEIFTHLNKNDGMVVYGPNDTVH